MYGDFKHFRIGTELDISEIEASALEYGFENWEDDFKSWDNKNDDLTEFYHLGREIGLMLEQEEEKKFVKGELVL